MLRRGTRGHRRRRLRSCSRLLIGGYVSGVKAIDVRPKLVHMCRSRPREVKLSLKRAHRILLLVLRRYVGRLRMVLRLLDGTEHLSCRRLRSELVGVAFKADGRIGSGEG